jgi:hypothetical protein
MAMTRPAPDSVWHLRPSVDLVAARNMQGKSATNLVKF